MGESLKRKIICTGVLVVFWAMSGCGYQLQDTRQPKGFHMSSLAIPLMPSPSSSLGFEGDFTMMIRKEFVSQSQIPLVSKNEAAYILAGNVREIWTEPLSYKTTDGSFEVTSSRWLKIKLAARLTESSTGTVIWDDPNMEEMASFTVESDPLKTRYNQRRAAQRIAQLLVEKMYLRTMERF